MLIYLPSGRRELNEKALVGIFNQILLDCESLANLRLKFYKLHNYLLLLGAGGYTAVICISNVVTN